MTAYLCQFCVLVLFICSCQPKTHIISVYEDDWLIETYEIDQDSLRHGLTTKFFPSGSILEKATYNHGQLQGPRLLYYENGTIEIEEKYCDDQICDTLRTFYPNGAIRLEGVYVNGEMKGIVKVNFESGGLKEEVTFERNEENGPFTEYYKNGRVKWKGNYLNGPNEFGLLTMYDSLGIIAKKMICDSLAVCQTIWTPHLGDIEPIKIFR